MWRVGVDSGGTFTDVCLVDATTGDVRVWKVPSTPDDPSRAIAHGVVDGLREAAEATPAAVEYFGHGTTVATNALIQHRGADTGLITTEGFRDLLEIGRQRRPHLYDLQADKPPVLVPRARRHEVRERLRHDGRIETPLDLAQVREAARALRAAGARSIAVCFLYCYVDPRHEQAARRIVEEECPGVFVTCSHEVAPEFREYERLSTVVVNAYLGPVLAGYLERLGETLVRAAYSTNVKERRDSSTCLFDARGRTLCQAMHIPMHLGSLMGVVEHVTARHPLAEIRPGDVFIGNDAYTGSGTHLPDIVLVEPVFLDGEVIAWATNIAHHADFVDRGHAHIYQEGLRIPPVKLYRAGAIQQDVLDLILLNCQVPRERLNDLRAQMASNRLGIRRFQSLCGKYGRALLLMACDALLNYTERMTRAGIATIPPGVYEMEDRFDTDEIPDEKVFKVKIAVTGEEMSLSFESPPQVRAGLNLVWTGLLATVYYAVKTLVGPEIPANAGLFRPIHVLASSGTMLNCTAPAAVNSRTQTCQRVVDLIHGALAAAIPDRIIAACNGACVSSTFSGVDPRTGRFYVYLETIGGGSGARATKDGLDGVHAHITNTSNLPVEALEAEYPLVVERYALVEDSGGPGTWRGGLGLWRQIRAEGHECHAFVHGSRRLSAPWGLFGGREGGRCRIVYSLGVPPPVRGQGFLGPGQSVAIITPGAGGYGDPRERDRALVRRDLAEGVISEAVARDAYGLTERA